MECGQCSPSQPFVVLTVEQFVGHGGGPLERERKDSHVHRKTVTLPLIFRKNTIVFMYSSSHPSHVKNSIPFSQFLRLRRLCSDDSDFSEKSEAMCQFFDKRGYPVSVVQAGRHFAQQIDR